MKARNKVCTKCGVIKSLKGFYKRKIYALRPRSDGYRTECIECCNKTAVEHQKKHKERYKGYTKAHLERNPGIQARYVAKWQKRNPEAVWFDRFSRRLRDRNLTLDQFHSLAERQDFLCAICGHEEDLVIDHDHVTDVVRGLVCNTCNVALGMLKDSPVVARSAAAYLDKHHARRAISAPATLVGDHGPATDTAGNHVPVLSKDNCFETAATACGVS